MTHTQRNAGIGAAGGALGYLVTAARLGIAGAAAGGIVGANVR